MNIPSTPFRLGYFLERRHEKCFGWPAIEYRGIDRLDFAPADNHERTAEEESLENAYLDALDSGELNSNRQVASYYEELFLELGIDVEVVYAEVTWTPEYDADWFVPGFNAWRKVHESLGRRPEGLSFLGFDISYPFPSFHSAIAQPGLHESRPEMGESLNSNGLFDDIGSAKAYARAANETDDVHGPFCVLAIWGFE